MKKQRSKMSRQDNINGNEFPMPLCNCIKQRPTKTTQRLRNSEKKT